MIKSPEAALALANRHLSMREAHEVVTRLFDTGEAIVDLPRVVSAAALARDLAKCNVVAKPYGAPPRIDVKAIRDGLDMSQSGSQQNSASSLRPCAIRTRPLGAGHCGPQLSHDDRQESRRRKAGSRRDGLSMIPKGCRFFSDKIMRQNKRDRER
jgi:hypothetical protein